MFASQNMSNKRRRDDDSDSEDGGRYATQQPKKSKTWFNESPHQGHPQNSPSPSYIALRPSPSPPRIVSDLEAMTPAHSDVEADSPPHTHSSRVKYPEDNMDYDMDYNMDTDSQDITVHSPDSSNTSNMFMRPAMLNASLFGSDPANNNSRIPTPIHPTFKRSRMNMNGLLFPTSGSAGGLSTGYMDPGAPTSQTSTSQVNGRQEMEDDRSRRMPSPISEDDDSPDTPTALTQSQLSRLSFSPTNPADQMDTDGPSTTHVMPPTPRGRKRSGALTGMARFIMGYRDDCEKCRQRVPGHYSHFLP